MNHPEDGEKIGRLRELMFEQVGAEKQTPGLKRSSPPRQADWFSPQAHILEYGLAVHEKVVPQDMRPLHKKLVDQFHLMKSSLGIQVRGEAFPHLSSAAASRKRPLTISPSPPPATPGVPRLRACQPCALHQREPADLPELCAEHHQPGRRPRGDEAEVSASSFLFSFPFGLHGIRRSTSSLVLPSPITAICPQLTYGAVLLSACFLCGGSGVGCVFACVF